MTVHSNIVTLHRLTDHLPHDERQTVLARLPLHIRERIALVQKHIDTRGSLRRRMRARIPDGTPTDLMWILRDLDGPYPQAEADVLRTALRLWKSAGRKALDDALLPFGSGRRQRQAPLATRQLLAKHPTLAGLETAVSDLNSAFEVVRWLRPLSQHQLAVEAFDSEHWMHWDVLLDAHRTRPFSDGVRRALLERQDCPSYAHPPLLDGFTGYDRGQLLQLHRLGHLTTDDLVRHAAPCGPLLALIDGTIHRHPKEPWASTAYPWLKPLRELAAHVEPDPRPWLNAIRLVHNFTGTFPELLATARAGADVPAYDGPKHSRPFGERGSPTGLLLYLAPEDTAVAVLEQLTQSELDILLDRRQAPLLPGPLAAARRLWRFGSATAPNNTNLGSYDAFTREEAQARLKADPLDLHPDNKPGSRWIWNSLLSGHITGPDLVIHAHQPVAALEVIDRCRGTMQEAHESAVREVRWLIADTKLSPDGWAVLAELFTGFPGTLTELFATAKAAS